DSLRTPIARSWAARSWKVTPSVSLRPKVGSPLSSRAQLPRQVPSMGSTAPTPTTRVGWRASGPTIDRANPVVRTFTVEAGVIGSEAFTDQSTLPSWSATTTPQSPGAALFALPYHSSICAETATCAAAGVQIPDSRARRKRRRISRRYARSVRKVQWATFATPGRQTGGRSAARDLELAG